MNLTIEQIKNTLYFLGKTTISGAESEALTGLKMVFAQEGQRLQSEIQPKVETKKEVEKEVKDKK